MGRPRGPPTDTAPTPRECHGDVVGTPMARRTSTGDRTVAFGQGVFEWMVFVGVWEIDSGRLHFLGVVGFQPGVPVVAYGVFYGVSRDSCGMAPTPKSSVIVYHSDTFCDCQCTSHHDHLFTIYHHVPPSHRLRLHTHSNLSPTTDQRRIPRAGRMGGRGRQMVGPYSARTLTQSIRTAGDTVRPRKPMCAFGVCGASVCRTRHLSPRDPTCAPRGPTMPCPGLGSDVRLSFSHRLGHRVPCGRSFVWPHLGTERDRHDLVE